MDAHTNPAAAPMLRSIELHHKPSLQDTHHAMFLTWGHCHMYVIWQ